MTNRIVPKIESSCVKYCITPHPLFHKMMITIRPIRESDAPAFREVLDSVCRERLYLAQLEAPPLDRVEEFVRSNVQSGYPQLVADDDGIIVGWCDAIPGDALSGTTHVGRLGMGVSKEYRGNKLGRRLITATMGWVREIGLEKIELSVHASNHAALSLYRSLGFKEEGRKSRAWCVDGQYDDIILMGLEIESCNTTHGDPP